MGAEDALAIAERLIYAETEQRLDDLTRQIFLYAWERRRYREIAELLQYEESYVRACGATLFQLLSQAFGADINKSNFKGYIQRSQRSEPTSLTETSVDSNFVGREKAIAELDQLIAQDTKIILIQGKGGLGKTTLATKYLEMRNFSPLLELWMATEAQNITPVESIVEEWLRRNLNEDAGRDFGINLERLRQRLRNSEIRIGILIDNLETGLDGSGKFIESRRPYVDLLRVLSDLSVNAVTLITSRERLNEASVNLQVYYPEGIDQEAWIQYFSQRDIEENLEILQEMWQAFGGNAKAMRILSGVIETDFDGDIEAYWQQNSNDLLIENELNDLVVSQFTRLSQIDPEAYRLLCRLGCYRYQDVSYVSIEGVCCLLWDVPAERRNRVVRSLQDRSLLESRRGKKYWLHPMIRTEAIAQLRASDEWNTVQEKAAEFWMSSVQRVETVDDALRALEAYHHYLEIGNFDSACNVILETKNSYWGEEIPLGWLFYRLGLLEQMVSAISRIIDNVQLDERTPGLYNLLGYIQRLSGNVQKAIRCHEEAGRIADKFQNDQSKVSSLLNLGLCKKDVWEIEAAIQDFKLIYELAQGNENIRSDTFIYSQCCLAYLYSCLGQPENALAYANQVDINSLPSQATFWGVGYSLLYLAATYRNLNRIDESFALYRQTMSYSEENHFTQIKANALHGMAQLYRSRQDFPTALSYHASAIDLLEKIGATCDLAEAKFQLGLTYQAIGQPEASQSAFDEAIALFNKVGAPLHIQRVKSAMTGM